ncbi:DNA-deoxyinosine glycosylase [Roseateles depolymerans]|uniref:G:T/U mismatch-specific DNA glycosylase n=1 Tax=Roseateles depolymerans TaxID=76731 RepID=A0A0U3LI71_9BURK|nr:DNA-deoxyinosine glycosylase [Roseateles depolymerans]ALV06162.1 G:T/U mismatch-specific DNA glycosylase [Roseateles depolymerans]REG11861.1 G/U mismatch-specific uracil-DNA glycosylase [Roseateles depolymerans]
MRWQGLAPVMRPDAQWLLLGSFPGLASLKAQQYYGHPRNQFWRLVGDVRGVDLVSLPYEARLAALQDLRIALWDVISETEREGSLDSAIRRPDVSDLARLLRELPALRVIGFNGGTAGRLGQRLLGDLAKVYRVLVLPSSSPAHTMPYDDKLRAWRALNTVSGPPIRQE